MNTTIIDGVKFTQVTDEVAVLVSKNRFVKAKSVKQGDWILTGDTPEEFKAIEIKAVLHCGPYVTWLNTKELGARGMFLNHDAKVCSVKKDVMAKELGR